MTKKTRPKLRLLVIVVAAIVGIPLAHSQGAPDKSVHGVLAVGGTATEADRASVSEAIETALTAAGWVLPELSLTKENLDKMLGCAMPAQPWLCVPVSTTNQQIVRAMIVKVEPKQATNGLPMVAVTATAISTSKSAFVVLQRPCEQCTPDKLKQVSTALVTQLVKDLASRAGDTAIEVVSNPADAEVTLDHQKIAATGNTFTTFPGEHTVVIEKKGYEPESRVVQVKDGQTVRVDVSLHTQGAPSRVVPIALTAGGAVLVVGGVLIGLDQQDGANDKYTHPRATAVGVTVGAVGVAAIAAGIYLWLRNPDGSSASQSAPAIITTSGGGAGVGWTGVF